MMNKLHSRIGLKFQSISQFFIQALLFSVLALTAPQIFAAPMDKDFDHYNTNFPLDGAHKRTRCDACHIRGIFKGTPQSCQSCHDTNSKVATSKMSTTHVRVSGTCDTCHNENSWESVRMDHTAVTGTCKSCHGVIKGVTGKNSGHLQTTSDCEICHSTRAWLPAKFEHTAQTTNCIRCHNGSVAVGKNTQHIQLLVNDCEVCHTNFRSFKNVKKPMPHDGLVATGPTDCAKCHNGQQAIGKSANHVTVLLNECGACHNTRSFKNIKSPMPHDGYVSTNCRTCHEGQVSGADSMLNAQRVRGHSHVDPGSINDCSICHKSGFRTWDGGTNRPVPPSGNAPQHGGHFVDPIGCNNAGCHNPPTYHLTTMVQAEIKNSCSDCHTTRPAKMLHIAALPGKCSTCHANGQAGSSTAGKKVSGAAFSHATGVISPETSRCDDCHLAQNRGGSFLPVRMSAHDNILTTRCGSCHKGQLTHPGAITYANPQHLSSAQCNGCHARTTKGSFNNASKSGTHSVSTNCAANCHNTGATWPTKTDKMKADHKTAVSNSNNCTGCHRDNDATWLPPTKRDISHNLLIGFQGDNGPKSSPLNRSCARCH